MNPILIIIVIYQTMSFVLRNLIIPVRFIVLSTSPAIRRANFRIKINCLIC